MRVLKTYSQVNKPPLTWDVIDNTNWHRYDISDLQISDDGKYVIYSCERDRVLQSTNTKNKKIFKGVYILKFIPGTNLMTQQHGDTIGIFRPESLKELKQYTRVISQDQVGYRTLEVNGKIYLIILHGNQLTLYNTQNGNEINYQNVSRYYLHQNEYHFLYSETIEKKIRIHFVDLKSLKNAVVMESTGDISGLVQNEAGGFAALETETDQMPKIIVYDVFTKQLKRFDQASLKLGKGFILDNMYLKFAANGRVLLFSRKKESLPVEEKESKSIPLNVWSYKDISLPMVNITPVFYDRPYIYPRTSYRSCLNIQSWKCYSS